MSQTLPSAVTLSEGHFAPDFTVETDDAGTLTLSDFRGKKNVVVYFYPKDDTPGCTIEANDFTKLKSQFDKADTVILGISRDDTASHRKFRDKYCLSFPLGFDENGSICEAYGTWVEKNNYGKKYMGIQRDTFLIGKEGKIAKIWRKVKVENHAQEVLDAAQGLR